MAGKSTINITFKLDGDSKGFKDLANQTDGLKAAMQSAMVEAEKFRSSVTNWSQEVVALGSLSNAVGNINSALSSITAESQSFNKAMKAVNTMAGEDAEGFKELQYQVAGLAKTIPVARDELANGLYQVISNGVPKDNWLSFLEASARASVGGIANLGQAVTVTSTIIKNYGLAWEDAAAIQDKIQLTAKNGVTSFAQLGEALPSVAGSAAQLGVSIDELLAVFATCTGVTGNTAEVSTQLAGVLKALISPTNEAARAAAEMGIQFDAAAVKEAGGLDNFLKVLDSTIQQYAASTGQLSETIYGNLFGSVRALRLLTSLTGEQAETFTNNAALMADSAGTMDAAYEQMSSTVEAHTQILGNMMGGITDVVAAVTGSIQPIVSFASQVAVITLSITSLGKSLTMANSAMLTLATRFKTLVSAATVWTTAAGRSAIATQGWGIAARTAAAGMTALQVAVRGLLIASGIGAIIAGVTLIIDKFANSSKAAKTATDDLAATQDSFKDTFTATQAEINEEVRKLDDLIKAHGNTSKAVQDLNNKYGAIFGTYKTAEEWKSRLIASSRDYCTQLAYEAKMVDLNKQLIDAQFEGQRLVEQTMDLRESGQYTSGTGHLTKEATDLASKISKNDALQKQLNADIDACSKGLEGARQRVAAVAKNTRAAAANAVSLSAAAATGSKNVAQQKTRYQELDDLIRRATQDYITQSDDERAATRAQIAAWKDEQAQIKLLEAEVSRPVVIRTMQDIDDEIAYQTALLRTQGAEQAAMTQAIIDDLQKQKKAWTEIAEIEAQPIPLDRVKNLQQCNDAIDYYSRQQQTTSAEEYSDLQKIINGYNAKADAITRGATLQEYQGDVGGYSGLSTTELRIKVRAEGYDTFVKKIQDLRVMLSDDINPVSDDQRQEIEALIDAYARLARQSAVSFDTLQKGWSNVKDIKGGIDDITGALSEDATVWERITGVVDGFIEIYQGIASVIEIIQALTTASEMHTAQKEEEGAVAMTTAAEEVAADAAVAAADTAKAASSETAAIAEVSEAAAGTFAAHSSIPFVGIAIAAAMVAAMIAVMASLKFAKGGIAYGPTLGLFGEYPGAATNPEVVAPLDRLRSLLKDDDGMGGRVRFRIEGRELVGVLEKEYAVRSRR